MCIYISIEREEYKHNLLYSLIMHHLLLVMKGTMIFIFQGNTGAFCSLSPATHRKVVTLKCLFKVLGH